jgi:hypothetical protein
MTARRRLDVFDLVHELCEDTQHREFYMRKRKPRYHTTDNPPLLVQLYRSAMPSYTQVDGAGKVATSRPAASVDAIDTAIRIRTDAARWLRGLGADDSGDAVAVVRRLGSLTPSQEHCGRRTPRRDKQGLVICCTAHRIEGDIRRWWTWARTITGWDLPAWQPDNTCPLCGTRGSLRIRLVDRIASCVEDVCRETWDENTLGLLAEHIRGENGEMAS